MAGHLAELPQPFIDSCFEYGSLLRAVVDQARRGNDTFVEAESKLLELHGKAFAVECSLLLVDNSRFSANYYTQALKDLPVRVIVEENGYAALLRVLQEPFDILVTSLEVPTLNGKALIGALRLSSSPNRNIKTILLTSNPELGKQKQRGTDASYGLRRTLRSRKNYALRLSRSLRTRPRRINARMRFLTAGPDLPRSGAC